MNILAPFDGISCGQLALKEAGIKYDTYYASEVDKYAIQITQGNFPDTVQLGDINNWPEWDIDWLSIGLILGGPPCQGVSVAGKGLGLIKDPRSKLFFVWADMLDYALSVNPNIKFLMENVRMKKEYQDIISDRLGVQPVDINSNLVSAQNRLRYYWANWCFVKPGPLNITWGDIREYNAPECHYYSQKGLDWIRRHGERKGKKLEIWPDNGKCQMIEASHYKNYSSQRYFGIEDVNGLRYISVLECEKAQTLPDGYTNHVSNTQRYKAIGNGWTVKVIAGILEQGGLNK